MYLLGMVLILMYIYQFSMLLKINYIMKIIETPADIKNPNVIDFNDLMDWFDDLYGHINTLLINDCIKRCIR